MESDTHLLYFTKLSGKSQDFYFLVGIHLNRNSHSFISENVFKNVVCKMSAILSRLQCVHRSPVMTLSIMGANGLRIQLQSIWSWMFLYIFLDVFVHIFGCFCTFIFNSQGRVPSSHLLVASWTSMNNVQWNFNHDTIVFIQENVFYNVTCKILATVCWMLTYWGQMMSYAIMEHGHHWLR